MKHDLKFKMQLLEKQLMEVKNRKEIEITERDGQLQEEYEDRLQKALEELREVRLIQIQNKMLFPSMILFLYFIYLLGL